MSSETFDKTPWVPKTEEEKTAVRRQLNRILKTSHFKNSKRYPALFRFVVEETLEGRGEFLKERLLGIQVFDRPADYDTASDPIVRVTIAEIRKRIAQYYHDDAHEPEMRIELLPGRYEPEFRLRAERVGEPVFSVQATEEAFEAGTAAESVAPVVVARRRSRALWMTLWGVATAVALAAAGWSGWRWMHPSAISQFWAPVLGTHKGLTVCVPMAGGWEGMQSESKVVGGALVRLTVSGGDAVVPRQTFREHETLGENVVFSDVRAAMRTTEYAIADGRRPHLLMSSATTLDDLRAGPSVLIGGLDNQWSMRTLAGLRFQFAGSDSQGFWVMDKQHPEQHEWSLDLRKSYAAVDHDYAIVARVHDATTGEPEVIVAGIGVSGTVAASELLGDAAQQEALRRRVGSGFKNRDFEAVIRTDVVNGMTGEPTVLAVAVW